MAGEDSNKGFTVKDRRRFSSEGEANAEQESAASSEQAGSAGTESAHADTSGAHEHRHHHEAAEPEITFTTFVVGLSTQALAMLGEMPDPSTGNNTRDLVAAQQLIDILGMLRDKTRGNLDRDEEKLLDAILFDLRMKYVELARHRSR